jgi:hypothetical protein
MNRDASLALLCEELPSLIDYMSTESLRRIEAIITRVQSSRVIASDPIDLARLAIYARDRKAEGLLAVGGDDDPQDHREQPLKQLLTALDCRHQGGFAHQRDRLDAMDLWTGEIEALAQLAETARAAADFEPFADVIQRLRYDGLPLTLEAFERLVLWGVIPGSVAQ